MPGRWRGREAMPGRFAETLDSDSSTGPLDFFFTVVGLATTSTCFSWEESRPWHGLLCRAGMWRARYRSHVGRAIKRGWASQYSLGEPVLIGRAIKRGWGEPSNEVGRASAKGPLGEPTFTVANACACLALCLLGTSTSACSARLLKCLLGTASACSALCLLGTFS